MPVDGASTPIVEHTFRHAYASTVARLARRFGFHRIEMIEDAVSLAFLAATRTWAQNGPPEQPVAWLSRVARNNLIDELRHSARYDEATVPDVENVADDHPDQQSNVHFARELADDELRMLFVCANPAVPVESQLVFTLKVMCGFSVSEIARRLFITEENVQKRLERARAKMRLLANMQETPPIEDMVDRRSGVLQVIYLLFNEGYLSARADQLIRRELCEEGIRLCSSLANHKTFGAAEADALLALMQFHAARFDARLDANGTLVMLEDQDRSKWNQPLIAEGLRSLARSGRGDVFSKYHAEACIAGLHCIAPSYAETDWRSIVEQYEMLERFFPSPMHTMNRAIATAAWKGADAGLAVLRSIDPPAWLRRYYLWDAAWGELERRNGNLNAGRKRLTRALEEAPHPAEKDLLRKRLILCGSEITEVPST
jgi:RNA polymerase sigma-70 factor (ECF subfamily)